MPIQAKGRFPKPSTTYRDDGSSDHVAGRITIEEYRALKSMPRGEEALKLLQNVGSAVKPIMMKHNWRLPLLVEIYPKEQSLLGFNVNSGRKIALRLRHASNHNDFIDQESLIETMLHELAHNLRGPHDDIFFQHLDALAKDWYELQSSSTGLLPGQGFLVGGTRLGGESVRHLSPTQARLKAAEMAERRRRQAILMSDGGSGQRLGDSERPSMQELAGIRAEAAERRRRVTHHCPSDNVQLTQDAAQEQEEEELLHGIQVITIKDDGDDVQSESDRQQGQLNKGRETVPKREDSLSDEDDIILVEIKKGNKKTLRKSPNTSTTKSEPSNLVGQTRAAAALRHNLLSDSSNGFLLQSKDIDIPDSSINGLSRPWNCQRCTLLNEAPSLLCQACEEIRPGLSHWLCQYCNHKMLGDYSQYWLCTQCGRMKTA